MTEGNTTRFRFFLPNSRILSEDEIANLAPEKIATAESGGMWLEIDCPNRSCIDSEGNIHIPAEGIEQTEKKGTFPKLFCPENSCEIVESTDLP